MRPPHRWQQGKDPGSLELAVQPSGLEKQRRRRCGKAGGDAPPRHPGRRLAHDDGVVRPEPCDDEASPSRRRPRRSSPRTGSTPARRPPDSDAEIAELVGDIYERYEAEDTVEVRPAYSGKGRALEEVVGTFQRCLHLPDPRPLHGVLATVLANRITTGEPVWVVIVGGSSRGKTELLLALKGADEVRIIGSLTVAALLSGTVRRDRKKGASGGVLLELGEHGLLVVKDFGAILSLHRDTRAQVLQALRDIYDGLYTRDVGADGGMKLEWQGSVGLVAGATSALDNAHSVLAALGERWLTLRLADGDEDEMAAVALAGTDTGAMRAELQDAVAGFLANVVVPELRQLDERERALLGALAVFVCYARSPVERERDYKREIVHVHQPEGPGRLARQLHKLYVSLEAMGVPPMPSLVHTALDSIPSPRRDVLVHMLVAGEEQTTTAVAKTLGLPRVSANRALEELAAHRLVDWRKDGQHETAQYLWKPTARFAGYWRAIAAEIGETLK